MISAAIGLWWAVAAHAGEVRFTGEGHAYHPMWSMDGRYVITAEPSTEKIGKKETVKWKYHWKDTKTNEEFFNSMKRK